MYVGKQVTLRPFTPKDSQQYLAWVNDPANSTLLGRALPVSPPEHDRWYESMISRHDAVAFSIELNESKAYIGNVWLWGIHWIHRHAELRILLGPEAAQGRGYGTEACQLLLDFAFGRLGLHKVYLYVIDLNPRAKKAFEKAGFREEGLLKDEFFLEGQFRGVYRMAAFKPSS
ncbi:MAG: GNAT family N-acetyltransferase [Vulcanimicrobiota bacterium]